jgi:predicted small metal-binding protein
MAWSIRCECGWQAHAESGERAVAAMRRHLSDEHPDLDGAPSPEDLMAMAEES